MEEIQIINENNKIIENTKLIREMFDSNFSKRQMDLIYSIISLIQPDDNEFVEYQLSYDVIGRLFNPSNPYCKITINDIEKSIKGIMNKSFQIESDKEITYYHYVKSSKLNKEEKYISFKIDNEVREFYLQLKTGEFTVFLLKDILALSTIFQCNLFRWLACNSGFNNKIRIKIDDAKSIFYGNDKITTSRLIEKIDNSLNVINKKTNINASYEKVKGMDKKTIAFLDFHIINNYKKKERNISQLKSDREKRLMTWEEKELAEKILKEQGEDIYNDYLRKKEIMKINKFEKNE